MIQQIHPKLRDTMNRLELPANIKLMDTHDPRIKQFKLVTSLDTFDGMNTNNFHPEGLFSTEIFGRVGTPERDRTMSFIHTKIPILHPFMFKKIIGLRALYKGIITGKQYATWNKDELDFTPSDMVSGETGFFFFLSHLHEIQFKRTSSDSRDADIELVYKAIKDKTIAATYVPVYPAGLRDAYVEEDGRVTEDEVNPLYRSLISASNALPNHADYNDAVFNTTRVSMQNAVNNIFDYFWNLYSGKRGFARDKFYSRGVFNGTRNVLTAACADIPELGVKHVPNINNTVIGLYQTMKGVLPVTIHAVLTGWLSTVFSAGDGRAYVTDRKTLKQKLVNLDRAIYDKFNTPAGIEKLINGFSNKKLRTKPVMVDGDYLGLVFAGEINGRKVFKFFSDIDDLPKGLDRDSVRPITWIEFFYTANYRKWNTYPMVFTRYPVAGLGSTYLCKVYCKTTVIGEQRWELGDDWEIKDFHDGNDITYAYEYPIIKEPQNYFETAAPATGRLGGLGADFDGD
jgi:hypothetical protein